MGRRNKKKVVEQLKPTELRARNREYIRNEVNSATFQWQNFKENCRREDQAAIRYKQLLLARDAEFIPEDIMHIINETRRQVAKKVVAEGGSLFSHIRHAFLNWDSDSSGGIDAEELMQVMRQLNVRITSEQANKMVRFFQKGKGEMNYDLFLEAIKKKEPSLIAHSSEPMGLRSARPSARLEDGRLPALKPPFFEQFLATLKMKVQKKMEEEGGTEFSILRHIFLMFDWNCSHKIDAEELQNSVRVLGMQLTRSQAEQLIAYYDVNQAGEIDYEILVKDIVKGSPHFLQHSELTARSRMKKLGQISEYLDGHENIFLIPKPFHSTSIISERFKDEMKKALATKFFSSGGSVDSWFGEYCRNWDKDTLGSLTPAQLIGAVQKLNIHLSEHEAQQLCDHYDTDESRRANIRHMVQDIQQSMPHFMGDGETSHRFYSGRRTSRTPRTGRSSNSNFSSRSRVNEEEQPPTMQELRQKAMNDMHKQKRHADRKLVNSGRRGERKKGEAAFKSNIEQESFLLNPEVNANKSKEMKGVLSVTLNKFPNKLIASSRPSQRAPSLIEEAKRKIKEMVRAYRRQLMSRSQRGSESAPSDREALHGLFVRFDQGDRGFLDKDAVVRVFREMGNEHLLDEEELRELVTWFGRRTRLDYGELVASLYGPVTSRPLPSQRSSRSGRKEEEEEEEKKKKKGKKLPNLKKNGSSSSMLLSKKRLMKQRRMIEKRMEELEKEASSIQQS